MYETVPQELKSLPNWVGWKLETRDGKPTKVPYSKTGTHASSTDPTAWVKFDDVCNIPPSKEKGIGFVFDGKGIVGIDIDHCFALSGTLDDTAKSIVGKLNSYTEISPSGQGLHIFIKCDTPPYQKGKHGKQVEVYSTGRYFTVTGNKLTGSSQTINTFTPEEVRMVLDPFLPPDPSPRVITQCSSQTNLSDDDIISIASKAQNSNKFETLMRGSTSEYGGDRSSADLALASILAFYTTDANQIERIMRKSGLVRDKWDRIDYIRDRTIGKAIQTCTEHFESTRAGDAKEGKIIYDNMKTPQPIPTSQMKTESEDVGNLLELEIKAAKNRGVLPPFPEIEDGLFKEYVEFGKRVSYSLHEFHFAAFISVVSMAIKRRVFAQIAMTKIYPNVFAMVVGHTTISGKSVACNIAIDSLSPAIVYEEPLNKLYSTNVIRGTISEPALIQGLDETYNSLWYYDDCAGFFEDASNWNAHILGTMCSLYDCTAVERTLSRRGKGGEKYKWSCPTPFVSLLFNTTNKDIETIASARLFTSGFFPRLMWFYGQGGSPRKNEDISESDKAVIKGIYKEVDGLRKLLSTYPDDAIVFGVSDEIEEWKLKTQEGKTNDDDESYRIAASRGFIHAYKIAMILTMVDKEFQRTLPQRIENADQFTFKPIQVKIPKKHALAALKIVNDYLIPRMMYVYELCNNSDFKNHQVIVRKTIVSSGGSIERAKLLRKTHLNSKDLNTALNTMVESEEIKMYSSTKDGNSKPTTFIVLIE